MLVLGLIPRFATTRQGVNVKVESLTVNDLWFPLFSGEAWLTRPLSRLKEEYHFFDQRLFWLTFKQIFCREMAFSYLLIVVIVALAYNYFIPYYDQSPTSLHVILRLLIKPANKLHYRFVTLLKSDFEFVLSAFNLCMPNNVTAIVLNILQLFISSIYYAFSVQLLLLSTTLL